MFYDQEEKIALFTIDDFLPFHVKNISFKNLDLKHLRGHRTVEFYERAAVVIIVDPKRGLSRIIKNKYGPNEPDKIDPVRPKNHFNDFFP